jgi:nucleotidyltransferase/DNA polymerase involved in DNA repair
MVGPRLRVLAGLALVAAALALLVCGVAVAAVPTVLLAACLVARRYVGERAVTALRSRQVPRRRPTAAMAPRRAEPVVAARGGLLMARSLAKRPPPLLSV